MGEMDQGIKRLLQLRPQDLLALALPGAEYLGTLPVDVATEPQLVLDNLLRVRFEGVECAVDVEAEARPHPDIGRRLFEYGARATIVTGLPVISVVVWLEPNGKPVPSPYELRVGSRLIATWHFIGIELYHIPAQELIAKDLIGLLPLIPFAQGGQDLAVIEEAAETLKERVSGPNLYELEGVLAAFATRTFTSETILAIMRRLNVNTDLLRQSALYREWTGEAREEGREEGREETLRQSTLAVLGGRFGALLPELVAAISQADSPTLEALMPLLGTISLEDLRARLGLLGK